MTHTTGIEWDALAAQLIAYAEAPHATLEEDEAKTTAIYHDVEDGEAWMWQMFPARQEVSLSETLRMNMHPTPQFGRWFFNLHGEDDATVIVLADEGEEATELFVTLQVLDSLYPKNGCVVGVLRELFNVFSDRVMTRRDVQMVADKYRELAVLLEASGGRTGKS